MVQRALYPEGPDPCHAVVLHPPGGIAGGDDLRLRLELGPGSHALVTTPGAGRWYRTTGLEASQRVSIVADGATIEWLPQETIVYDAARARMETEVELRGGGRFLGWEILCLGRTASGERFERGAIRQRTIIRRDGKLVWSERGALTGGDPLLASALGMRGRSVLATLILAGDAPGPDAIAACRAIAPEEDGADTGLSCFEGLVLARYLGRSSERAKRWLRALWRILRPAGLGREAEIPRIWNT
ncbi:Urease accessory protein UreD [Vulgatibacter incomptus]|uniref:Urease accessory protein UreD n=1 Tax=Vulgatibacter incomptus TaxID=1391653 RepID=A0A0K1PFZ6_9BACT|nr:Urease accessory protein UreD [Vulgatibacter incomptus]